MKEARKFSRAFLIHVGHKNCKKKNSNFFVSSENELSSVRDNSNDWNAELFAVAY